MIAYIANLLTDLKVLKDRLSPSWAAKLDALETRLNATWSAKLDSLEARLSVAWADQLDADVSTRAPASTALSNALWDSAKAAKLAQLDAAISSRLGSIKSIQRGSITLTGTYNTATVTAVTTAKAMLMFLGARSTDTFGENTGECTLELVNSTTVAAERETSGGTAYVHWQLVEFN